MLEPPKTWEVFVKADTPSRGVTRVAHTYTSHIHTRAKNSPSILRLSVLVTASWVALHFFILHESSQVRLSCHYHTAS